MNERRDLNWILIVITINLSSQYCESLGAAVTGMPTPFPRAHRALRHFGGTRTQRGSGQVSRPGALPAPRFTSTGGGVLGGKGECETGSAGYASGLADRRRPGARLPTLGAHARDWAGRETPPAGWAPGRLHGIRCWAEAAPSPGAALGRGGGGPARAAAALRQPRGGRACQAGARRGHGGRRPRRLRAGGGCPAWPPGPAAGGFRPAPAAGGGAG